MEHDWLIYAGESEGNPLVVMLDKAYGRELLRSVAAVGGDGGDGAAAVG